MTREIYSRETTFIGRRWGREEGRKGGRKENVMRREHKAIDCSRDEEDGPRLMKVPNDIGA